MSRPSDEACADAMAHVAAGRYGEALAVVAKALDAAPDDASLLFGRASTLYAWGRYREALAGYAQLASRGWSHPDLDVRLGWSHFFAGKPEDAEACMRRAAAAAPRDLEAQQGLSQVLMAQERLDEAVANCEGTLELWPDDFHSLEWIGECRLKQGDPNAAEAQFRRAIAVGRDDAGVWTNLGASLAQQGRYREAIEALEHSACLEAKNREDRGSFFNLALAHRDLGCLTKALEVCEGNLAHRPSLDGYSTYSHTLLVAGRLVEGWHHYDVRWLKEPYLSSRPGGAKPIWAGQDLRGKTIVLRMEQGFGDAIQFLRYAPHVKALGATVLLDIFGPLQKLAASCPGVDRVLSHGEAVSSFDYYVHLLSLPRIFGTDLGSIPGDIPYLHADPALATHWANRLGADDALRVGLVWAGNPGHVRDRSRSIPLHMLAPLVQVDEVRFFSLQKGPAEAENLAADQRFVNLGPELEDFSDTAAAVSQLDLVICVDTAVGHLAGALGKPVWLMVQKEPDWRWMLEREDSPWYPTMRLFRQSRYGDWSDVIERVKTALEQRQRSGSEITPGATKPTKSAPLLPRQTLARLSPGHKPGFSAVTETRVGVVQYFPDEPIAGDSIDWYGEYLQPQLDLLGRLVKPGATLMEVGSGVGMHALFLAAAIGPAGHLFLYESRPLMQRVLRQNLAANRVANVTPMQRTLGHITEPASAQSAAIAIPTETLDELRLEALHLLKIGVDVDALGVLAGAADTLWRLRPLLFIAARNEAKLEELMARARDFSYRCWRMQTTLFNPDNFNRRENDIFVGGTAMALLAIPEEVELAVALDGCVEL